LNPQDNPVVKLQRSSFLLTHLPQCNKVGGARFKN
jgi:hypothetical protein